MGHQLNKLRKLETPKTPQSSTSGCADGISPTKLRGAETGLTPSIGIGTKPTKASRHTNKQKCKYVECRREGKSHKQAVQELSNTFERNDWPRSSTSRWVKSIAEGALPTAQGYFVEQYSKCGRGNSEEGKFTELLVPYLNRNFITRKNWPYHQQWTFWWIEEIQFLLVFDVSPIRIAWKIDESMALENPDPGNGTPQSQWCKLYRNCIRTKQGKKKLDPEIKKHIEAIRTRLPINPPPFKGKLKFCTRSIRTALKIAGYVHRKQCLNKPIWVKKRKEFIPDE